MKTDSIKKKPWTYAHSAALGMRYAFRPDPGGGVQVMTEDKVSYSPAEVSALADNGMEIDLQLHLAKKIFNGTVMVFADKNAPGRGVRVADRVETKSIRPDEYPGGGNIPLF